MNDTSTKIVVDAKGKSIGRVASKVAFALRGKDNPAYQANVVPDVKIEIVNASKARVDEKMKIEKIYKTYSGYPGGLKETSFGNVISKKGYSEIFRMAVKGMLPANKLRAQFMKNLTVTE